MIRVMAIVVGGKIQFTEWLSDVVDTDSVFKWAVPIVLDTITNCR